LSAERGHRGCVRGFRDFAAANYYFFHALGRVPGPQGRLDCWAFLRKLQVIIGSARVSPGQESSKWFGPKVGLREPLLKIGDKLQIIKDDVARCVRRTRLSGVRLSILPLLKTYRQRMNRGEAKEIDALRNKLKMAR
jgi:hypothetical protein